MQGLWSCRCALRHHHCRYRSMHQHRRPRPLGWTEFRCCAQAAPPSADPAPAADASSTSSTHAVAVAHITPAVDIGASEESEHQALKKALDPLPAALTPATGASTLLPPSRTVADGANGVHRRRGLSLRVAASQRSRTQHRMLMDDRPPI